MGIVTIHVFDDARNLQQDFTCELQTLLASMRYFQTYLKKVGAAQDVEISVHCDVVVFAWLLRYAKTTPGPGTPKLTIENCLPILIASHFLKMESLVTECVQFIADNLLAIIDMKIDISSNSDDILGRLAKAVPEQTLETLWLQSAGQEAQDDVDRYSKVTRCKAAESMAHGLYEHKVQQLIADHRTSLRKCKNCGDLFPASQRVRLVCRRGKGMSTSLVASVLARRGQRGQALVQHEIQPTWKVHTYVDDLREKQHKTWRDIYWHLWGYAVALPCHRCNSNFLATHWRHCSYHVWPQKGMERAHPTSYLLIQYDVKTMDHYVDLLQSCGHILATPYKPPLPPPKPKQEHRVALKQSTEYEEDTVSLVEAEDELREDCASISDRGSEEDTKEKENAKVSSSGGRRHNANTPTKEREGMPRTLLGRIAESTSSGACSHWSPSTKFKTSTLGKAMRMELLWEEDVGNAQKILSPPRNAPVRPSRRKFPHKSDRTS
ncbi:hypothetical protein BSKO_12449 [Bryopsis sp. KO-2023]|nr:hypothetical protein BSKO_12449 [Bryopsis sp. KO-2023]